MLISTNKFKEFSRKALPLAIATVLGSGIYQVPANATLPASAACTGTGTVTCTLFAKTGSVILPGAGLATVSVPTWGYTATDILLDHPGGPVLVVNQGDTVIVSLTNNLPEATSLLFQGQSMPPDTAGVAAGGTKNYTFTATTPGTYLYEAGLLANKQHQPAMGLYGALVVRPAGIFTPPAGQAYGATTAFDDEALVLVSEIDPLLNNKAGGPATFDMRKYSPRYFLINGKAHPSTEEIPAAAGNNILLRYVNAGVNPHSMATLGLRQKFIANDGSVITYPRDGVSETIAPGQTLDAIATVPASAVTGSKFAVYDAGMNLNNSNTPGMGGMLTFVALAGTAPTPGTPPANPGAPADTVGPVTTGVAMSPNPSNGTGTVALTATANDTATGNSTILGGTYSIANSPTPITGNMTLAGAAAPVQGLTATISAVLPLTEGIHAVTVTSTDSVPNTGAVSTAVNLVVDRTGPVTTVTPIASNGVTGVNSSTAAARVLASALDNLTSVTAVEGYIDANATAVFPFVPSDGVFNGSPEAAFADIPLGNIAPLASGNHVVHVRAKDAAGNWGAFTNTNNLLVDRTAPAMTAGSFGATPNPTFAAFVLSATATDAAPTLGFAGGEWFEGANPGVGLGHPMGIAACAIGKTICSNESARALNWAEGNHAVTIRAKDAASNWSSSNLVAANRTVTGTVTVRSPIYFSTTGNTNPPGVAGTADDADIYNWSGTAFSRTVDVTAITNPIPSGANVDGLRFVDATHFYVSFTADTTLPVLGSVQDEDIVFYNAGTWSVIFNGTDPDNNAGTANGLTNNNHDIDAFTIGTGSNIYFSTTGNTNPPGVAGTADNSDIYLWNGTVFSRVVDVTTIGVPGGANVDGLKFVDTTHFYLSFDGNETLTNASGTTLDVQDEDVVYYNNGTWSVYFDGTAAPKSLTNANHDIDAFDIP